MHKEIFVSTPIKDFNPIILEQLSIIIQWTKINIYVILWLWWTINHHRFMYFLFIHKPEGKLEITNKIGYEL